MGTDVNLLCGELLVFLLSSSDAKENAQGNIAARMMASPQISEGFFFLTRVLLRHAQQTACPVSSGERIA